MFLLKDKRGLTFIEILIVTSVIGILSTVVITTINFQRQQQIAREAVTKENLQKVSEAIEAYRTIKKRYPEACSNPAEDLLTCDDDKNSDLSDVIAVWPSSLAYVSDDTNSDGRDDVFAVYTESVYFEDKYYKYSSEWTNEQYSDSENSEESILECAPENISVIDYCKEYGSTESTAPALTSINVTLASSSVRRGQSTIAYATATYSDGSTSNIASDATLTSSNVSVATVEYTSEDVINVTGVNTGTSNITAAFGGLSSYSPLTVEANVFTVSAGNTSINLGASTILTARFNGSDVTTSATWRSSNSSIVRVYLNPDTGRITATGAGVGTATITASYGGENANLSIRVRSYSPPPPPSGNRCSTTRDCLGISCGTGYCPYCNMLTNTCTCRICSVTP